MYCDDEIMIAAFFMNPSDFTLCIILTAYPSIFLCFKATS